MKKNGIEVEAGGNTVTLYGRVSYPNLLTPSANYGNYGAVIMIAKDDCPQAEIEALAQKIADLAEGAKLKPGFRNPLSDGDASDREEYQGHWIVNTTSQDKIVHTYDAQGNQIKDEDEAKATFIPGHYVAANCSAAAYKKGQTGVSCYLNIIVYKGEGEGITGRVSPNAFLGHVLGDQAADTEKKATDARSAVLGMLGGGK